MAYNHGIRVQENPTSLAVPVQGTSGLQVVFGTAPINLAEDPYNATNKLIIAYSYAEATRQLGYSDDFKNYTLCQSIDASFRVFNVAPIIFCNVLDPQKHTKAIGQTKAEVKKLQAVIETKGILLDKMEIKGGGKTLIRDEDYMAEFDQEGNVIVTLLDKGATVSELEVSGTAIDPEMVTAEDIIGGYDPGTGKETGLELVRQVYPQYTMTAGLLSAPGWSHTPEVGAMLMAKTEEVNGLFRCECLLDLDSSADGAQKYTDCLEQKNTSGYAQEHAIVLWPKVKIGEKHYDYSAVYGALVAYTDATNDNVPHLSPSNKMLNISCTVDGEGNEIILDQQQANVLNGYGIVTAINMNGWKAWGNNTSAYPTNTDPKDRWISCRRMFSWWANSLILTYADKVDSPANFRLIESIVDAENMRINSYVSQGKLAGGRIEYSSEDNPVTEVIDGKVKFKMFLAPYTPAEDILNELEFDPSLIEAALSGGE